MAISEWLSGYDCKKVGLHQLVSELTVLQDSLTGMPAHWLTEFDRLRFALEEVNAVILDEGQTTRADDYERFVCDLVEQLRELVNREE